MLLGIALAGKPPTTKGEQWLYRLVFIFAGLLVVTLSWIQYIKDERRFADLQDSMPTANVALTGTTVQSPSPAPEKQPAAVPSKPLELQQKYATLLRNLSRDPSLTPDVRERIVIATAQLNREADALKQTPRDGLMPYFQYAMNTLAGLSEKEAAAKGDKSVESYYGVPENLNADGKTGKRSQMNVGEVKFQNNPEWSFQVIFAETTAPKYEATWSISCKAGLLILKSGGESIETKVELVNGESSRHDPAIGDAAKANISDALQKLVASEADAVDFKK